ncbi:MAG: hypothetical protein JNL54_08050 [Kineosporiaceae bacterium]|nr:hypothetical protein [Kineosporiaceae bacterium]
MNHQLTQILIAERAQQDGVDRQERRLRHLAKARERVRRAEHRVHRERERLRLLPAR